MRTQPPQNSSDLAPLVSFFDSDDIFIKSIRYESPAGVEGGWLIAPNALGTVTIAFEGFEGIANLELTLTEVKSLAFDFAYEVDFHASHDAFLREYTVTLNGLGHGIRCKGLSYSVQPR
ncbi:hypothetical protein [Hymenobacter jejuensis]|uniref:Uncharacterized protein n=1 Tax=Hymenobacter jejuensis TaxID=2502781 RepID=A0A5B8A5I4_9BACT|nr:hypothetical protein [Hymenobacter jejuensis]QDA61923.1 hypothetical protein FHG12_18275 [Hymenobacter jejuensis]